MLAVSTKAPDSFLGKSSSIIFSKNPSAVAHMKATYGEDYLEAIFASNLKKALWVFHRTGDSSPNYGYRCGGLLDDFTASAFVLGLGIAVPRLLGYPYWPIMLGIFLTWFLGATLTIDSPGYCRLTPIAFFVYFVPMLWGREIYETAKEAFGWWGRTLTAVAIAAGLVLVAAVNLKLYFFEYDRDQRHDIEMYRSTIARDARDDGASNVTYVLEGSFPTDLQHSAHRFVAGSSRIKAVRTVEGIKFPRERIFTTATFLVPNDANTLLRRLIDLYPQGRVETRDVAFREPRASYTRYIVPIRTRPHPKSDPVPQGPRYQVDSHSQGWGELHVDRSVTGRQLSVGGEVYTTGLGTHSPSRIILSFPRRFKSFAGACGVDDEVGERGSAVFKGCFGKPYSVRKPSPERWRTCCFIRGWG